MLSRLRTWHLRTGFSAVVKKGVNGAATPVFFSSQTISRQQYSVAEFCEFSRHSILSCHSESIETESIAPSIRGEKKKHPERKPDCKGGGGDQVTCRFATSLNSSFRLFAASIGRSFSINQRWFSTRAVGAGGPVDRVRTADPYVATELALDAVVKIFTVSSSPNYFLPWQNKPQREVTGSGLVSSCLVFPLLGPLFFHCLVLCFWKLASKKRDGPTDVNCMQVLLYQGDGLSQMLMW